MIAGEPQQNQQNNSLASESSSNVPAPADRRNDNELLQAINNVASNLKISLDSAVKEINTRLTDLEFSQIQNAVKLDFTGGTPINYQPVAGTEINTDFLSDRIRTVMPKNLRRQTLFESVRDTEVLDPDNNEARVTLTRVQPDYSHIQLDNISDFKHVLWFVNQILKYKSENNLTLLMRNLVTSKARTLLIARFKSMGLNDEEAFYGLPNSVLLDYIYTYATAKSMEEGHLMLSSIAFKGAHILFDEMNLNGDVYFEKFILYRKEYIDTAALIAYTATIHHGISFLPPCTKSHMGQITLILQALNPASKNFYVANIVNRAESKLVKQWSEDPLGHVKFLDHLESHLSELAALARRNRVVKIQATTDFKTGTQHGSVNKDKADPRIRPSNHGRFHHLFTAHDSDDEKESNSFPINPHREPSRPVHDSDLDVPDSEDNFEFDFNALQTPSKPANKPDQPNGCFKMSAYGTCANGAKCKFSHDPAVLTRTCLFWVKVFQNSSYYKPQSFQPRTLAHTHQSTEERSGDH